jgi:hypothetical protein
MKLLPLYRSLLLGLGQLALLATLGAKLTWDRSTLPRVWAKTVSVDPSLPIRGRYVELHLQARIRGNTTTGPVALRVENQELVAMVDPFARRPLGASDVSAWGVPGQDATLSPPVAFFISEHAPDPTRLRPGDELWAEVTVPGHGPPRPIRLGIKRGGLPIQPL